MKQNGIEPVAEAAMWKVSDFSSRDDYTVSLSAEEVAELDRFINKMNAAGKGLDHIEQADFDCPLVNATLAQLYAELKDGRGFVVMAGLPVKRWSQEDVERVYWGMGTQLGEGVSQSVMGDRLGHVRDVSREDPHARAYRNRTELNPHTDISHIAALCCVKGAKSGGVSLVTSSLSVHNAMLERHPDDLELLYKGFYYHRRGEEQPGQEPVTPYRVPVFSNCAGDVSCRWVKPYAYLGQQAKDEPIEGAAEEAISRFLELANSDELQLRFTLQPGEILWFNNLTNLHARTAFTDWEEPDARRHLLRLWLHQPDFRQTVSEIEIYEGLGISPVEGQVPSFDDESAMQQMMQASPAKS